MPVITLKHSSVPPSLRGTVASDDSLVPRYWSTVWADGLRSGSADSSNRAALAAVDALYGTAEEVLHCSFDQAIGRADYKAIRTCLDAHLQRLNNAARQRDVDLSRNWQLCRRFVEDMLERVSGTTNGRWEEIKRHLYNLEQAYRQLAPARPKEPAPIRSLSAVVVEDLYEIFDPASPRNPFRSERDKFRNFLIFLILLHLGLRRGELLILEVNAFQTEYDPERDVDVCWLIIDYIQMVTEDDELPDPRVCKPSLKNNLARRLLPVSPYISALLDVYLSGYRRRMAWPHLFSSQKGRPLSPRRLNEIFEIASSKLSPAAMAALQIRGKESVQPHDLRHTCAVRRLAGYRAAGNSHSEAVEKLRAFFGWGEDSPMPGRYGRAFYETDYDTVWQDKYDSYVNAIRALERVA